MRDHACERAAGCVLLDATARIGRIIIHPTNPDIVYAASLGHAYTPQPERGVYMGDRGRVQR